MMNIKDYQTQAQRTVSNSFHPEQVNASALVHMMHRALKEAALVDEAKKALFYGREPRTTIASIDWGTGETYSGVDIHLLHAILGVYTEAVELLELLYKSLREGEEINPLKLINEMGDVMWYQALAFEKIGVDFEQVGGANNAKLKARYPEKFVDQKVRDEDAENEKIRVTVYQSH